MRRKRATTSTVDRKNIRERDITLHASVQPFRLTLSHTKYTDPLEIKLLMKSEDFKNRSLFEDKKFNFIYKNFYQF